MPFAAALQPSKVGQRKTREANIFAERLDRREDGKGIEHPVVAALGYGEGQLTFEQRRADQASAALRGHGVNRVHVRVAAAKGDDPVRIAARSLEQPVAVRGVIGDDRDATGLEALRKSRPWRP